MDLLTLAISPVDAAYSRLREHIMDADLLPNTHHVEQTIADQFGLEPSAVHECVLRLESEGLVQSGGMGGFWVTPISITAIAEIYNRAAVLEARAAYIAATVGANPIALSALYDTVRRMQDASFRNDVTRWARADHHFHRSLVQCTDQPALISAALPLSEPLHRARMLMLRFRPLPCGLADSCSQVVEAISKGSGLEAHDIHMANRHAASATVVDVLSQHLMGRVGTI